MDVFEDINDDNYSDLLREIAIDNDFAEPSGAAYYTCSGEEIFVTDSSDGSVNTTDVSCNSNEQLIGNIKIENINLQKMGKYYCN